MPRGRWRRRLGHGPWRGGACPRYITRFIEPCLLLLLREGASHGYSLVEGLQRFGFAEGSIDPSIVYRTLREMEQEGWVVSEWDVTGPGPPRRVYRVTPAGEEYLRWWIDGLQRTREELDRFLAAYEAQRRRGSPR